MNRLQEIIPHFAHYQWTKWTWLGYVFVFFKKFKVAKINENVITEMNIAIFHSPQWTLFLKVTRKMM